MAQLLNNMNVWMVLYCVQQLLGLKKIKSKLKSIENQLKVNWCQLKVNWNQLKVNWNQLKINWNQLKRTLQSIENQLKSIIFFWSHTIQDRNLENFHIKEDLKIVRGGDTNQDPTLVYLVQKLTVFAATCTTSGVHRHLTSV